MTAQTDRLNAALTGRYTIERELGAGGMATVFLAEDLKHKRKVALKVLKPELAAVLGADRFVVEITTTAAMQHPHILPLFDSGTADGFLFYVMPFIEGETLRDKLNRETQLGVDEAVRIAREVLDALQYAHEHGIVHRDVKPENILLHGGHAMVADFGIALAVSAAAGGRMTETGLSLGTPHYMSPEQATAEKEITARSDVYSLGSVLYEMLTGQPPHVGGSAQQIIMKIITEQASPVTQHRKSVPSNVAAAVAKSLEKLPADRFESAKEFSDALANPGFATAAIAGSPAASASARRSLMRDAALVLTGAVAVALLAFVLARRPRTAAEVPTTRFTMHLEAATKDLGQYSGYYEVSPDGRSFVFPMQGQRNSQLYVRKLDDPEARALAGTEGATGGACFSADGASIAFFTRGALKRVSSAGGTPTTVVTTNDMSPARGCTWSGDVIVVSRLRPAGLARAPAAGGALTTLTAIDSSLGESAHMMPAFLADGRTIAFASVHGANGTFIAFATLDGKITRTTRPGVALRELQDGMVVYQTVERTLVTARFDARTLTLGSPVPVLDNVFWRAGANIGWSASPNGTVVFAQGEDIVNLTLVARDGSAQALTKDPRPFVNPRISPDGARIAANIAPGGDRRGSDIWIFTRGSQTLSMLTTGGGFSNPVWSRDGSRIAFSVVPDSGRQAGMSIAWRKSDGSGANETIVGGSGRSRFPFGWSADGRTLIYDANGSGASEIQVHAITLGDTVGHKVIDWAPTTRLPSVSPDGHWIAYASDVSGRYEIYVSPYPGPGGHWPVSIDFGDQPVWAHNGHELFYRDRDSVVVATVKTSPTFEVVSRKKLFADQYSRSNTGNWDVMPDDQHFVMLKPESVGGQFTVITNWLPELKAKLGLK